MHALRSRLAPFSPLLTCPLLLVSAESNAFADVATDWNCAITSYCAALAPDELPPSVESRILATVHLAMLDAARAAVGASGIANTAPLVRAQCAAAQAAHDVVLAVWPEAEPVFAARLTEDLREFEHAHEREVGRRIGAESARPWISKLGLAGVVPYRGDRFIGRAGGADATWRALPPLVLQRADQFRAGNPATDDATFAVLRFNRCKTVRDLLHPRSAGEWSQRAGYWRESSTQRWNRAARELAAARPEDLLSHAQLFALLNVALTDAGIAAEASRRYYRSAQSGLQFSEHMYQLDGGFPVLVKTGTPPVSNFPSVEAVRCGAAAAVLIRFCGHDTRTFTLAATAFAPGDTPPASPRTFPSISAAALEGALAGMFAGQDFKEACTLGYDLGWRVGNWIAKRPEFASRS